MAESAAAPEPATGDEPEPKKSRAGRDLPVAVAAGVILLGLLAASLLFAKWLFVVLALALVWIGVVELSRAMAVQGYRIAREPILVGLPIMAFVAYRYGAEAHLAAFGAIVLVILLYRLSRGTEAFVRDATGSVFVAAYLPLMLGFALVTVRADDGAARIATFVALTVGSDIGGYAAGVLFGKHPMAKHISPKKSWEGFAGSMLFQVIIGALAFHYLLDAPAWQGVVAGAIMTITATLGDFVESAIKRDLGVKDMGDTIPGHGGVMDRLDSLIPNAFVSWALFGLFLGS